MPASIRPAFPSSPAAGLIPDSPISRRRTRRSFSAATRRSCAGSTRSADSPAPASRACSSSSAPRDRANRPSCAPACGRVSSATIWRGCRCRSSGPSARRYRASMGSPRRCYEVVSDPRFSDGMRQRGLPRSRADIQDFIEKTDDGLAKLLARPARHRAGGAVGRQRSAADDPSCHRPGRGTIQRGGQGRGQALHRHPDEDADGRSAHAWRSSSCARMRSLCCQSDPSLAALPKDTFTLDMMLEGSYRAVIEGPARLIEPPLADRSAAHRCAARGHIRAGRAAAARLHARPPLRELRAWTTS